ncbi:hypothetical protein PN36_17745 [Candidatus Thiomargarita nelsonii]|uniref:Uncharacterized protein n=1 Tax=Candidatus Thiomargarita nelsonii TaxID=1003181 RepID=A0A4E0R172_9GAMM|nr:hypothetical protein PN36_17745 [Candidatus Thiomargarita nelsonii]
MIKRKTKKKKVKTSTVVSGISLRGFPAPLVSEAKPTVVSFITRINLDPDTKSQQLGQQNFGTVRIKYELMRK